MDIHQAHRYRTNPIHAFPWLQIATGYHTLASALVRLQEKTASPLIVIDGYAGVDWEQTIEQLWAALGGQHIELSTEQCFRPGDEIERYLAPFLTDDPVFGRLFPGHIEELWHPLALEALKQKLVQEQQEHPKRLLILYGFGASTVCSEGIQIYIDVPKDQGQQRAREKAVCNVGATRTTTFGSMYKRLFFVDWPMLNRLKRASLARLDIFVDATSTTEIRWSTGQDFRCALHALARQPFRVKPNLF